MDIHIRKAQLQDLKHIVGLLSQDELGKTREKVSEPLDTTYLESFDKINTDPNHYLMLAEYREAIVGTCHLTLLPSLTFKGSLRLQIEAVRIHPDFRGQKIGRYMLEAALNYGQKQGAIIAQLSTHKMRKEAKHFYESLGFEASHEGMKKRLG